MNESETFHESSLGRDPDRRLTEFVRRLADDGRIVCESGTSQTEPSQADQADAKGWLRSMGQSIAMDSPGRWPPPNLEAALWAAKAMLWASTVLVDRAETNVVVPDWIVRDQPAGKAPSDHAGVDITFRYAVDLVTRSEKLGDGDPLSDQFVRLFGPWPLATVGTRIPNSDASIGVVISDPSLRMVMIDRILLRRDSERQSMGHYAGEIRRVIGGHPELQRNSP